jgi:hypothetical protein
MITTVGDLLDYSRQELNDIQFDGLDTYSFWKDDEIIEYINNAQQEFSQYTRCLPNYTDYTITLVPSTRSYTFDTGIIEIFGAYLVTSKRRLDADSFANIQKRYILNNEEIIKRGNWEAETGIPRFIVTDMELNKLVLYPIPLMAETLALYVYKIANSVSAVDIEDYNDVELEIPEQHRNGLIFRIMSLAYNKLDSGLKDANQEMLYSQKWESFKQDAKAFYDSRFNRLPTVVK